MIPVEKAVELANDFCYQVFHKAGIIEEVELENNYWLITLSIEEAVKNMNELPNISTIWGGIQKAQKNYKQFKIDGETGEVLYAKIRQLN